MKPATEFFFDLNHGFLVVIYAGTEGGQVTRRVYNPADLKNFLQSKADEAGVCVKDLVIRASSSLDFPEEYCHNPDTIAMVRGIRA